MPPMIKLIIKPVNLTHSHLCYPPCKQKLYYQHIH